MKNNGEDYKKLDYYVNLDESDKKKFEKLYLKYEGNHFKVQKAMQMDKRTNIISIVLFRLAFLLFIIGRERMMGTVIFLGFLDGVVTCYGFIYKLSGTNVLVSIGSFHNIWNNSGFNFRIYSYSNIFSLYVFLTHIFISTIL